MNKVILLYFIVFISIFSTSVIGQTSDFNQIIGEMGDMMGFVLAFISMPYFILILILVLFVVLFRSIIFAGLSNIGFFKNDEKQLKTVSIVLAILMTIGLIGGGGISNGSWSPENITTNIGRLMTPFGTLSPLLLGFLAGLIVYMSVGKNNPDITPKKKLGWGFFSFALGIYVVASSNLRYAGSSDGTAWIALAFIIGIFGLLMILVPQGKGIGSGFFDKVDNLFGGSNKDKYRQKDDRESKRKERAIKDAEKKAKKDKFKVSFNYNQAKLQTLINDASSRINAEKENYKHEVDEMHEISAHIGDAMNQLDQSTDKHNIHEATKFVDNAKGVMNSDSRLERRNLKQNRRISRDFRNAAKDIMADHDAYEKIYKKLSSRHDVQNRDELLSEVQQNLSKQKYLNQMILALQRLVMNIETDENKIIEVDKELASCFENIHKEIKNLETASSLKDEQEKMRKKEETKKNIDSIFQKSLELFANFDTLINEISNHIAKMEQYVMSLINYSAEFSSNSSEVEKKINSIESAADERIKQFDEFREKFHSFDEQLSKFKDAYFKAVSVIFSLDHNAESDSVIAEVEGLNPANLMNELNQLLNNPISKDVPELQGYENNIKFLEYASNDITEMKRLHSDFIERKVLETFAELVKKEHSTPDEFSQADNIYNQIFQALRTSYRFSEFFMEQANEVTNDLKNLLSEMEKKVSNPAISQASSDAQKIATDSAKRTGTEREWHK